MARIRGGLAVAGVLALGLAACGGSDDRLNLGKAENEIRQLAERVYGSEATVDNVRCPSSVPIQKDLSFICTVDIDGVPLRVSLLQTNDKGNVKFDQEQAVIFTQKLEKFVSTYAAEHGRPAGEVSCGTEKVMTRAPGKELTCTVAFADGTSGVAQLVVNDTSGKVGLTSLGPTG